jgi:hypothetical protein
MKWTLATCLSILLLAVPAHAGHRSDSKTLNIVLISRTVSDKFLRDSPPKNEVNVGDRTWSKSILRNAVAQFGRRKGAVVGSDVGVITVTSCSCTGTVKRSRGRIKITATLPGGTLRVAGNVTASFEGAPVVGGTGDFARARGTLEVRNLEPDGDPALNVYRLRLP